MVIPVKSFLYVPLVLFSFILWGQETTQVMNNEKGLIYLTHKKGRVNAFSDLPYYARPNQVHRSLGELELKVGKHSLESPQLLLNDFTNGESENVGSNMFFRLTGEVVGLRFIDIEGDFVRLDLSDKVVWVLIQDLRERRMEHFSWSEILRKAEWKEKGWIPGDSKLGVHGGAGTGHRVILNVHGDLYRIKPLGKTNGDWFYVKVIKLKERPCNSSLKNSSNNEFEFNGWINLFNEKGNPSVDFFPRDCN